MGGVAIVTGASSGIGAATSRMLHERGFRVYAVSRRLDTGEHVPSFPALFDGERIHRSPAPSLGGCRQAD